MAERLDLNIGHATAYAYAKAGGYPGTEEEFTTLMATFAIVVDDFEHFSVTVETLPAGSSATASYADGVLSLGVPRGDKGETGETGERGPQGETGATGATGNGIQSISKTDTSGLTDTYTIVFTDGTTTEFEVENGKGIVSIAKTSTEGLVDTYTITFNDGTTTTFTVTNAISGVWGNITGTLSDQTDLQTALNGKVNTSAIGAASGVAGLDASGKVPTSQLPDSTSATWGNISGTLADQTDLKNALDAKQNVLTFDNAPVQGSDNPVKSGGIYTDQARQDSDIAFLNQVIAGAFKDDFSVIKQMIRRGLGSSLYPVGSQFDVTHADYTKILFDVVHHITPESDQIFKDMLPDGSTYGMVMLMHHVIYGTQFDREEAFYFAESGLVAGTYNVPITRQPWYAEDVGKTFQFTLASDVPAGGILCWGDYNSSRAGKNVTVYADRYSTTALQTAVMSEGSEGTTLTPLNVFDRSIYGSNDYEESGVRQWLNADVASDWWEPKTGWDRIVNYSTRPGFLYGFPADFKDALLTTKHLNRSNTVFDSHGIGQAYSTYEKMFLLSGEEVGLGSESGITCGKVFDFYKNATNTDRIKYDITNSDTARTWWLRVPHPSYANIERNVNTSGALNYSNASYGYGVACACVIG